MPDCHHPDGFILKTIEKSIRMAQLTFSIALSILVTTVAGVLEKKSLFVILAGETVKFNGRPMPSWPLHKSGSKWGQRDLRSQTSQD
jgi:hypothetical protein